MKYILKYVYTLLDFQTYLFKKALAIEASKATHAIQGQHALEIQEALRAQAEKFSSKLNEELKSQAFKIEKDLSDGFNLELAKLRQSSTESLISLQKDVSGLESQLSLVNNLIEDRSNTKILSGRLHQQTAALLALESALTKSKPIKKELLAIKEACAGDLLFESILSSIPPAAINQGVPTLPELRNRFKIVRNEVRKVALAPEAAPKLVGQIVGNVLATVSWAPKGYVEGDGIEEILSRSAFLLEQDDLNGAVKELNHLQGYPKVLLNDWETSAKNRMTTEEAVQLLRIGSAARHFSLAEK